jgi:hypothetical protein
MVTKTRIRIAASVSMLAAVLGLVAHFGGAAGFSPELRQYLEQQQQADLTPRDWVLLAVGIPLVVAGLAGFVGLLRFTSWSRPVSVATSLIGLLGQPFFGPTIEPGLTTALNQFASLSFGAVLATAYISPTASGWFEAPPNKPLHPTSGGQAEIV